MSSIFGMGIEDEEEEGAASAHQAAPVDLD